MSWRGSMAHKAFVGKRSHGSPLAVHGYGDTRPSMASGSPQVLPGGLAKLPRKRVGEPRNAE